jgi:hypothetical protein
MENDNIALKNELAELKEAWRPRPAGKDSLYFCSFCLKNQNKVQAIIVGNKAAKKPICICNECIDLCVDILAEQKRKLEAADGVSAASASTAPEAAPAANDDGMDLPECLRRTPEAVS